MKRDEPIPNAPIVANFKCGSVYLGATTTKQALDIARSKGYEIYEPRLNLSEKEYNEICKRRRKYNK